ncbi:hypothetical protein ACIP3B_24195 [Streptomyces anulatus]|uniref:hypothetical protein n=1 Tax=Streptomyces anulatus TaxID=1892 RepID=UPI0033F7C0C6
MRASLHSPNTPRNLPITLPTSARSGPVAAGFHPYGTGLTGTAVSEPIHSDHAGPAAAPAGPAPR